MIDRPRGTRDFTPEANEFRYAAELALREVMDVFNYHEIRTPTFEHLELFTRKSGADIVKQLYTFKDKGDRDLAMRPELTAASMRFYFSDLKMRPKPLKIFYMGNCFRYERPQEGRYREFWQFGAELIGATGPLGNAEIVALAYKSLLSMGLDEFSLRMGDLRLMNNVMAHIGISEELKAYIKPLIDKGNLEGLREKLLEENIDEEKMQLLFSVIATKMAVGPFMSYANDLKERLSDIEGCEQAIDDILQTCQYLKMQDADEITIDLGIARGLDYYVGMVFEVDVEALGAEKQVCGGGEYSLASVFDEKDEVGASGFAIGFDRVILALQKQGMEYLPTTIDVYYVPLSEEALYESLLQMDELRTEGISCDLDLQRRGMSKNLKYGNHSNPTFIVFIGEDELKKGIVNVKESSTREQTEVPIKEVVEWIIERCMCDDEDMDSEE